MGKFAVEHEEENEQSVNDGEVLEEGSGAHEDKSGKLDDGEVPEQYFTDPVLHGLIEEYAGDFDHDCVVAKVHD